MNRVQSMTCDLFWLAALATPQPKSCPQPQWRATCLFDGSNLQPQPKLYYIEVPNLPFKLLNIVLISKPSNWFFCEKLLKSSIFELQNFNLHQKKANVYHQFFHYCQKCAILQSHFIKMGSARTLQLVTALRTTACCGHTLQGLSMSRHILTT